jgi:hypothetical protein
MPDLTDEQLMALACKTPGCVNYRYGSWDWCESCLQKRLRPDWPLSPELAARKLEIEKRKDGELNV